MLVKKDLLIQKYMYVGELCWRKVFSLVKYVCWWNMYVGENHQNQTFDL